LPVTRYETCCYLEISNKSVCFFSSFLWAGLLLGNVFEVHDAMSTWWEKQQQQVFFFLPIFSLLSCFFTQVTFSLFSHLLRINIHAFHVNIRACLRASTHAVRRKKKKKTISMNYYSIGQLLFFYFYYLTLGKL
jgi:hypothetical protein